MLFALLAACSESLPPVGEVEESPTASEFLQIVPGLRPTGPRLTGSGYGACRLVEKDLLPLEICSPGPLHDPGLADALWAHRAIGRVLDRLMLPSAEQLHRLGLWELLWRDPVPAASTGYPRWRAAGRGFIDRALSALGAAAEADPTSAQIASDLGAAYLLRSQHEDSPFDLLQALSTIEQALAIDPCLRAAHFNQGLALAALGATTPAALAFERSVQPAECPGLARETGWAGEALERRDGLVLPGSLAFTEEEQDTLREAALADDREAVEEVVSLHGGAVTRYVEEEMLPEWGRLASSTPTEPSREAESLLNAIELIGGSLAAQLGDSTVRDAVRTVVDAGSGEPRPALTQAHRTLGSGYAGCRRGDAYGRLAELARSRRTLVRAASPFAGWAAVAEAVCLYLAEDYAASFETLVTAEASELHPVSGRLAARTVRLKGLLLYHLGDFPAALSAYRRAAFLSREARVPREEVRALSGTGETAERLGLYLEAWQAHLGAIRVAPRLSDRNTVYLAYSSASSLAARTDRLAAAAALRAQANEALPSDSSAEVRIQARIQEARLEAQIGRPESGQALLAQALEQVPDAGAPALEADLDRALGEILASLDPVAALFALDRAVDADTNSGYRAALAKTQLLRARLLLSLGETEAAGHALQRADREARERTRLAASMSLEERTAFAATTRELADERIAFQMLVRRRPDLAFEVSEQASVEAWTQWLTGDTAASTRFPRRRVTLPLAVGTEDVEGRLPSDTALIVYRVLPQRLLMWCFDDRGFHVPLPIERSRRQLDQEVTGWVRQIRDPKAVASRTESEKAADLAQLLLTPCDLKPSVRRLVLVPDGPLHGLPFAALVRSDSGHRVVQDLEAVVAPSVSIYLALEEQVRARRIRSAPRVAAFGYGGPSEASQALDWAEEEAARVVAAYGRAEEASLFTAERATVDALRRALPKADVLHIAAHAFGDGVEPTRAHIELAPGTGGSSRFELAEILTLDLSHQQVTVLSACNTAEPQAAARGGASTLALAFLAAGGHSVVGSLWTVDDSERTVDLAGALHEGLARGLPPVEALARAQRRLYIDGAPLRVWSVLQLYGAGGAE